MNIKWLSASTLCLLILAAPAGKLRADCAFANDIELKSLSADFSAWQAVSAAMSECGNFEPKLDKDFRQQLPAAFAADPAEYHIGGVDNYSFQALYSAGSIRALDALVADYGQQLNPHQLIRVSGKTMAIAMMVNAQHLMYRADILYHLGIAVPATYQQVLEAAEQIKQAGLVAYPLGGTLKRGWDLAVEFVNIYLAHDGNFFDGDSQVAINNDAGIATLELLQQLSSYMHPLYLASDPDYVQQQFQRGEIAMANLWASRASALENPELSQVVGLVQHTSAPKITGGSIPATTLWWDGIVIAQNISAVEAEAAFLVALEGIDEQMVSANNDAAFWLIDGYKPGTLALGAASSARNGARPYTSSPRMRLLHIALGDGVADFLSGEYKDAQSALAAIEIAYTGAAKQAGL